MGEYKGAPARESHTSTWLVSPALGYKKKMDTSRTEAQNAKLSMYIWTYYIIYWWYGK